LSKLTATQQEQTASEEQRIAKAVAERDAKQAQLQLEEEERKAAMSKSIAAHRDFMVTVHYILPALYKWGLQLVGNVSAIIWTGVASLN